MQKTPQQYAEMYAEAAIKNVAQVKAVVAKILANKARYEAVSEGVIPWQVIGALHSRESSLSFTKHLHNGDPLTARTVHVPAGRPTSPNPPFTWEQSAKDALSMRHLYGIKDWSIGSALSQIEMYNGLGYAKFHPNVNSPYLWAATSLYTVGKYRSDGHFDPLLVDKQIGCAAILKQLNFQ